MESKRGKGLEREINKGINLGTKGEDECKGHLERVR